MNPPATIVDKMTCLLSALEAARRSCSLYPSGHPRLEKGLGALRETLLSISSGSGGVKLTLYKGECFLDEQAPEEKIDIPWGFSDKFIRLGLASVVFPSDVGSEELYRFLKLLGTDARTMDRDVDIVALAKERGLTSIEVFPLDYSKMFVDGIGRPAEGGDREEEYFARLLTLWDPQTQQKEMSAAEIEALGRLAMDKNSLSKLMELSLKGTTVRGGGAPLSEGTVGAVERLAESLREIYPEQWDTVRQLLVKSALALDSEFLLQNRTGLLDPRGPEDTKKVTAVDEMTDDDLAVSIAEAMANRDELDDSLAAVLCDLIPSRERRKSLGPKISSELQAAGIDTERRSEMMYWWEQKVIEDVSVRDPLDPFFSSLLSESSGGPNQTDEIGASNFSGETAWFRDSLDGSTLSSFYFDDLRGFLGLNEKSEDLQLILGSYQTEFQELAAKNRMQELKHALEELTVELRRCGKEVTETLTPLLSLTLIDTLAMNAVSDSEEKRLNARGIARYFGYRGFRVVMEAIGRTDDWELLEELRQEIFAYGPEVVDELLKWLGHEEVRFVREALLLLRRVGGAKAVPKIEMLLAHSNPEFRAPALAALARIGGAGKIPAVERGLLDSSPRVVEVALDAVEEIGIDRFGGLVARLITSRRDSISFLSPRTKAIRLIGRTKFAGVVEELEEIIKGVGSWIKFTRDESLVFPAARALLQLDDDGAHAFVRRRAKWGRGKVRKACRQALREFEKND